MSHDLLHIDILTALLRKIFVDYRNGQNAVDALLQCFFDFLGFRAPCLNAQQACDGLQIILDAVMDFLDDR